MGSGPYRLSLTFMSHQGPACSYEQYGVTLSEQMGSNGIGMNEMLD